MLKVENLTKHFKKHNGLLGADPHVVKAVDGVSFEVPKATTFGLVGESGCGKTTAARMIAGILTPDSGNVDISGELDIVFQDPYSSLNPRMNIRHIVGEALYVRNVKAQDIDKAVRATLEMVKLPGEEVLDKYPHQFSGGERQRIAIARALIRRPDLLVLDEPVSSLDVSIQAGILNLLKDLQDELCLTYLLISHDLRVVEFMSDTVAVMKTGKIVEIDPAEDIYLAPKHEYTRALLDAIPKL